MVNLWGVVIRPYYGLTYFTYDGGSRCKLTRGGVNNYLKSAIVKTTGASNRLLFHVKSNFDAPIYLVKN
ncbi:MAG: hypothetical protein B6242_10495 [Anaerolineaceae bacterium 4572_78]|nr:MAG: hypothetical protein B6242_10495 [Anaerolineaceae bacterium 4572_78]